MSFRNMSVWRRSSKAKKTCRHCLGTVLSLSPCDIWHCVTEWTRRHLIQFGRGARDRSRNATGGSTTRDRDTYTPAVSEPTLSRKHGYSRTRFLWQSDMVIFFRMSWAPAPGRFSLLAPRRPRRRLLAESGHCELGFLDHSGPKYTSSCSFFTSVY